MIKRLLLSLFVAILSSYGAGHAATYTESIIPVDFTDISGFGSPIYLSDDVVSGPVSIGFDFDFYGVRYSTLYVSSNGFLTFLPDQSNGCCSGRPIPQADSIEAVVAAAWTDLHPGRGGAVRVATIGAPGSRVFILMYLNVPHYSGGAASTFNIKLFEGTNRIETHIVTASSAGRTVTVGIENHDGSEGIQSYYGSAALSDIAYAYSLFAPCLSVHGNDHNIPSGTTDVDPTKLTDFGVVSTSVKAVKRTFVLRNHGNYPLNFTGANPVTIEGSSAFAVSRQPESPVEEFGGESLLEITFSPGVTGDHEAVVNIASDDPLNDPYTFALAARSADPLISVTRIERFSSTPLGKSSRPQRLVVTNTGEVPVTGLHAMLPARGGDDYLVTAFASRTLLPGESAGLAVTFRPRSAGMRKAILEIRSDAALHRSALAGRGVVVGRSVYSPRFPHR